MPLMKTSNPALGEKTFQDLSRSQYGGYQGDITTRMTLNGTVNKTGILLVSAIATAGWIWLKFMQSRDLADVYPWMIGGMIGGLVFAMITIFKKEWAPVTAPAYALLEGLVLGGLSAVFELRYPGIAIQAVGLTFGTLFVMLFVYRTGLIKVTNKFRIGVISAIFGIALFYLVEIILGMAGINFMGVNGVEGSGLIGIGFSLLVVGVAALSLVLKFDIVDQGVRSGAPKFMEWYCAFGIMVTLIWLYIEILNLLSKMNRRN